MKRVLYLMALLLVPVLAVYGCSGGSKAATTASASASAQTGSLTVSAKFPSGGAQGQVGTAYIDTNTDSIDIEINDSNYNQYFVTLTAADPTATIPEIAIGPADITIVTYDSSASQLDEVGIAAEIVEGANVLTTTLIRGLWTFSSPILLNSTMPSSTETVTEVSIFGGDTGYVGYASIDDTQRSRLTRYPVLWKGTDLLASMNDPLSNSVTFNYCPDTDTCFGMELVYVNQFIGPSMSGNALDGGEFNLVPDTAYSNSITWDPMYPRSNRFAFFFAKPFGFDPSLVVDNTGGYGYGDDGPMIMNHPDGSDAIPDLNAFANTRVTGATTMEGNIVEVLEKNWSGSLSNCIDNDWNPGTIVNCPQMGPAKVSGSAMNKAFLKAISGRVGKSAAPDGQGCYRNLTWSGTDTHEECWDFYDYWDTNCGYVDGETCFGDGYCDGGIVTFDWSGTGDICGHSFTATGSQIPTTDLQFLIQ